MKRRYPVSSSTRTRAAADGRSRGPPALWSLPLCSSRTLCPPCRRSKVLRLPGRVRRRDPPGVRWRPGDWHAPPTGYLQEATRDTRGPDDAACAGPCCARQRPPTARLTTKPTRAGSSWPGRQSRWPETSGRPARRPPRTVRENSERLRIRAAAGSIGVTAHWPGPHSGRPGAGQTLTRARPLRRRAARIARPARVRMRSRNPCVFARRRLFGWNVRLLTGTPGRQGKVGAATGPACGLRTCESQPWR